MVVNENNCHFSHDENDSFSAHDRSPVDELNALVKRYSYFIGKSPVFQNFINFKISGLRGTRGRRFSKQRAPAAPSDLLTPKTAPEDPALKDSPYIFTTTPFCSPAVS